MAKKAPLIPAIKTDLHPRNLHRARYDFDALTKVCPELKSSIILSPIGNATINFADALSVKILNKALLKQFYNIEYWDLPENYLCPPIPGRADAVHYLADVLAESNHGIVPIGEGIKVLDIGMGANCIYPILGHAIYGWDFVGSDIDAKAIRNAREIVENNNNLNGHIICRLQLSSKNIFKNMVQKGEQFDLTMCNPPFHASAEEAMQGSERKWKNLGLNKKEHSRLNFGGQNKELWCEGGETTFIHQMIKESALLAKNCFWFSTLVSKKERLPAMYAALKKAKASHVHTIEMTQGQKTGRLLTWTFLNKEEQAKWRAEKWQ